MKESVTIRPFQKTPRQRAVLKLLNIGCIIVRPHPKMKWRLLDDFHNPISYVHGKTVKALIKKSLIEKKNDGCYATVKQTI